MSNTINQELIDLAIQYIDDLKRPPSGDSRERRIARIKDVLKRAGVE